MDGDAFVLEYAGCNHERLIELARGYDGLVPAAQEALRAEFARRGLAPPLIEDQEPKAEHHLMTVRRFRDLTEALVAKSMLESAGLLCFLQDENLGRMDWAYSNVIGGMRLQVPDDQVAAALELMAAPIEDGMYVEDGMNGDPDSESPPRCPHCGSSAITSLRTGHGSALVSLFLFSVPLPRGRSIWQCEQCATRWTDVD